MKKAAFFIYLLIIFLTCTQPVSAGSHYYFKQLCLREGFPSSVQNMLTDNRGFVWIGTRVGLGRFDGYELKMYTHQKNQPNSIPHNVILSIVEDKQHNLWILTENGVARYRQESNDFVTLTTPSNGINILAYSACSTDNGLLLGVQGGVYRYDNLNHTLSSFLKFDPSINFFPTSINHWNKDSILCSSHWGGIVIMNIHTGKTIPAPFIGEKDIMDILIDSQKRVWIASYNEGVKCYTPDGKRLASYTNQNSKLSSNTVLCIEEYNSAIWIGTDGGGINILNPETKKIKVLKNIPGDNASLPVNSICNLHYDGGMLWAATVRGGLIAIKKVFMRTYTGTLLGTDKGLSDETVLSLYEDYDESIWIGTDGGGLNQFNQANNKFKHFSNIWGNKVSAITGFDEDDLLLSYFNKGLFLFNKKTASCRPFIIVNDSINHHLCCRGKAINILQNTPETILIMSEQLYVYNLKNRHFSSIIMDQSPKFYGVLAPIGSDSTFTYLNDLKSVYSLNNETHAFTTIYSYQTDSDTIINSVSCDKSNTFWIGTNQGLYSYTPTTRTHQSYRTNLFTSAVSVICDFRGRIWIGTTENTLFSWSVKEKRFVIYSESDGLALNEYMNQPRLVSKQGDIYIGGVKGLLRIDKRLPIESTIEKHHLQLADIIVDGESVTPTLTGSLPTLSLPWDTKTITLRIISRKNIFRNEIYRYHIVGPSEQYIESYNSELIIHSLLPGIYTVIVSCSTKDGNWTSAKEILTLQITPPWHRTWWFLIICLLVTAGVVMGGVHLALKRKENKIKWAMKEHEQQVYEEKVRFLINISHELRTPLTLIDAPLKRLLKTLSDSDKSYLPLKGIQNQAQRMKNIINMVLDVRKMEVGENKLVLRPHLLNEWIKNVTYDFGIEATTNNIKMTYQLDDRIKEVSFDENKCETILTNLLINALKFSSSDTEIQIVSQLDIMAQKLRISVIDQGCGLKDVDINKLFTRFYQGNDAVNGSGIGLSYSKILVELHGGTINAKDNGAPPGATFFIELPLRNSTEEIICESKPYLNELINSENITEIVPLRTYPTNDCSVLLVDDNQDMTTFLKESLQEYFKCIYTASDGMEAVNIIKKKKPDIIVSDIMMQHMDGYELCKSVKENIEISHIPIILLTARNDQGSCLYGYKNGADGYLNKPFDLEMLLEQMRSLLRSRENVKRRYLNAGHVLPEETTFSKVDEQFLLRLNNLINENLDNPQLDVLFLYSEMGMSRTSLYNKLGVLTNMGVNDYINKLKMERAILLLSSTNFSVTEIAEKTGFSTLRYFSTAFKQYTGKAPSMYKEELKK